MERPAATRATRVLIIVQNLPVPRDRRVWLECQTLVRAGYQVSVICPKGPGDRHYELHEGVHLHKYAPPPATESFVSFLYEFVYCWLQTLRLALRVRRREGFDVIQACNPPDTYFALAWLFKPLGVKFVYDQHDLNPETFQSRFGRSGGALYRGLRLIERLTYMTADHVISTNGSYRRVALTRGKQEPAGVTVVRSGPDDTTMRRREPKPELRHGAPHLLVYVGVMGPQDGVDLAIQAMDVLVHKLGRDDVHLNLLGTGDSFDELQALVRELDLERHVSMLGWTVGDDFVDNLSTAEIGLCPDPMSPLNDVSTMNKIIEYMSFGLPTVCFDLTEHRVSAEDSAVYVPPNDVTLFAEAIAALLDDPERRDHMGAIGRRRVEESLAWRHQAPVYQRVYDELTGRRAS